MAEVNLLRHYPRDTRKTATPRSIDPANREVALQFGAEYFDGKREQGYGGDRYDGRWIPIARGMVEYFGLKAGDRVLAGGCAKGVVVRDVGGVWLGLQGFCHSVAQLA